MLHERLLPILSEELWLYLKNLLPHSATLWKHAHSAISDCLLPLEENEEGMRDEAVRWRGGGGEEGEKNDSPTAVRFIQ